MGLARYHLVPLNASPTLKFLLAGLKDKIVLSLVSIALAIVLGFSDCSVRDRSQPHGVGDKDDTVSTR